MFDMSIINISCFSDLYFCSVIKMYSDTSKTQIFLFFILSKYSPHSDKNQYSFKKQLWHLVLSRQQGVKFKLASQEKKE